MLVTATNTAPALMIPPPLLMSTTMTAFVLPRKMRTGPLVPPSPLPKSTDDFEKLSISQSSSTSSSPDSVIEQTLIAPTDSSLALVDPMSAIVPPEMSLRYKLALPVFGKTVPVGLQLQRPRCRVVGHRGAVYEYLENTREGFLKCAQWNCDAVELDVFRLDDGTLIVFHGAGTDRNPGQLDGYTLGMGGKKIFDLKAFAETQQLRFNPDLPEFACSADAVAMAKIPTLRDVLSDLKHFAPNMEVKIELKGEGVTDPVLDLVNELNMVDQCSFSSFDHTKIARVRELHPEKYADGSHVFRTGALFNDLPSNFVSLAQSVGASEVHVRYDTLSRQVVQDIHAAGMGSMAWLRGPTGMGHDTTQKYLDIGNEEGSTLYSMLMETGVEQLCVNRPDIMLQTVRQQQQQQQQLLDQMGGALALQQ